MKHVNIQKKVSLSNSYKNKKSKLETINIDEINEESSSSATIIDSLNFYNNPSSDLTFKTDYKPKQNLIERINPSITKLLRKTLDVKCSSLFRDKVNFIKVPQKILIDDDDIIDFLDESEVEINRRLMFKSGMKTKTESHICLNKTHKNFCFNVIKRDIENLLTKFYLPVLSNSKNMDIVNIFIYDAINKLNYFFDNESVFTSKKIKDKKILREQIGEAMKDFLQ